MKKTPTTRCPNGARRNSTSRFLAFVLSTVWIAGLVLLAPAGAHGQDHSFQTAQNAPGVSGQNAVLGNPNLAGYVQPVRILTPEGSLVSMWTGQGLESASSSDINVGLMIGYAYRLKVTHIPLQFGAELYPSIELLDRMHPPPGLEQQFPIQIVLTQDDLEKALAGRIVTKIIYVENPELALPFVQGLRDDQPAVEVNSATDPMRVADRLGRAVAIVRIGSRVPTPEEAGSPQFDFLSPVTDVLPTPLPTLPDMEFYNQFRRFNNRMNDMTRPATDVVPGAASRPDAGFQPSLPPAPNVPPVVSGPDYLRNGDNRLRTAERISGSGVDASGHGGNLRR